MREFLFRGKATNRIDGREYRTKYKNGDWVYGLLTAVENYAGFSEMTNTDGVSGIEVDKNTVGQYTGLTDKNGKQIFEGDVLKGMGSLFEVYFDAAFACFDWKIISGNFVESFSGFADEYEVIGNIHDNPELMVGDPND